MLALVKCVKHGSNLLFIIMYLFIGVYCANVTLISSPQRQKAQGNLENLESFNASIWIHLDLSLFCFHTNIWVHLDLSLFCFHTNIWVHLDLSCVCVFVSQTLLTNCLQWRSISAYPAFHASPSAIMMPRKY